MDTNVMFERATLLHHQGRAKDAINELKKVLEQDPRDDRALALYARCLFDQNEFDKGMELLDSALGINPDRAYYFYLKGFGYYRKDLNMQSITMLLTSISMQPYMASAYGLLAMVYIEERNFPEALKRADEGLAVDASDLTCLNARATALNKLKQTDAAIETMEQALARDPDNEFTHYSAGWNYLEKGRHREAAKHFREALRLNPTYGNAKQGLKEALKSRIPPYRWLLQYSFWVSNQGKKAGWIIPLAIYVVVRLFASGLGSNDSTSIIGGIVIFAYLVFAVATWIINPVANFFLLFVRDGKYALTLTEKWAAITVVSSLILGIIAVVVAVALPVVESVPPIAIVAGCFLLMAVPLGDIRYPLSFKKNGNVNMFAMILVGMAMLAIVTAYILPDVSLIAAVGFLVLFILNNWLGVFRAIRKK